MKPQTRTTGYDISGFGLYIYALGFINLFMTLTHCCQQDPPFHSYQSVHVYCLSMYRTFIGKESRYIFYEQMKLACLFKIVCPDQVRIKPVLHPFIALWTCFFPAHTVKGQMKWVRSGTALSAMQESTCFPLTSVHTKCRCFNWLVATVYYLQFWASGSMFPDVLKRSQLLQCKFRV